MRRRSKSLWTPGPGLLIVFAVGAKHEKIAVLLERFKGREWDPHYLGFFECFNRQLYFEAHEVLEGLWLEQRGSPQALFYKGLIQLAGAFVHLQKNRAQPAMALLGLARQNLKAYPDSHQGLNLIKVLALVDETIEELKAAKPEGAPLFSPEVAPRIFLGLKGQRSPGGAGEGDPGHP